MRIAIHNFLKIKTADIPMNGVVLLAGGNEQGKSSVVRAISACATQNPVPINAVDGKEAIAKGKTGLMVHGQEKNGHALLSWADGATLQEADGSTRVAWPSNGIKIEGLGGPQISPVVAGMLNWMAIPTAARLRLLTTALANHPETSTAITKDALTKALGINHPKMIDWVWGLIEADGWDAAIKTVSTRWSEATGAWRTTTGQAYGTQKAETWRPVGWSDDLLTIPPETLAEQVSITRKAVEDSIGRTAVSQVEINRLKQIADQVIPDIDGLGNRVIELSEPSAREAELSRMIAEYPSQPPVIGEVQKWIRETREEIAALDLKKKKLEQEQDANTPNLQCPACQVAIRVVESDLGLVATLPTNPPTHDAMCGQWAEVQNEISAANAELERYLSEENALRQAHKQERSNLETELEQLTKPRLAQIRTAQSDLEAARQQSATIQSAKDQIAQIQANNAQALSQDEINRLRQEEKDAAARMNAQSAMNRARQEATKASNLARLKEVMAPDGLPKQAMTLAILEVNRRLAEICQKANWDNIELNSDLDLFSGGYPHVCLSESKQFKCHAAIQMVFACLEDAPLILLDRADILDSKGRFGLLQMLRDHGKVSVVVMTCKRDYAEMVGKMFDAAYWIEAGTATQLLMAGQVCRSGRDAKNKMLDGVGWQEFPITVNPSC